MKTSVENILTIPMDPNLYKNEFYNLIRSRHYNHGNAYGQGDGMALRLPKKLSMLLDMEQMQ